MYKFQKFPRQIPGQMMSHDSFLLFQGRVCLGLSLSRKGEQVGKARPSKA